MQIVSRLYMLTFCFLSKDKSATVEPTGYSEVSQCGAV